MLPNFLIVGAQKAGTTSLYRYLQMHPDVHMPRNKEPDFFVTERNWSKGVGWYEGIFRDWDGAMAVGEASTTYSMHPHYSGVPARIAQVLPDVRLVYVVRDPIERTRSDYVHYRYPPSGDSRQFFQREWRSIDRALLENPIYLDTSRYAMQLDQYLAHFERDRILVITTEDLASKRTDTVRTVLDFIGVDPDRGPQDFSGEHNRTDTIRVPRQSLELAERLPVVRSVVAQVPRRVRRTLGYRNVPSDAGVMSVDLRQKVAELLHDDVCRLRDHLGNDFHCWGIA